MPNMVVMMCMTHKKEFDAEFDTGLEAVVLANGRYAYRAPCPWTGKGGKHLTAFKFCSRAAYESYQKYLDDKSEENSSDREETVPP
jgi:hypothetical protein